MTFRMSEEARTITIYNLRPDTLEYTGTSDVFIPPHTGLPACCTDIAPPDIPDGYVAIYIPDESVWKLLEDHRGKIMYDKNTGTGETITAPGPLPDTKTFLVPESVADVFRDNAWVTDKETARAIKISEVNAWRNTMENSNYVFEHAGHTWDCGKETRYRLEPSVATAKAGKLPAGFFWTDAENHDVPMSADELIALSDAVEEAMFKKGLEIHIRQREMKKELDELDDAEEIIKFMPGWKS
ncbi:DUF4376 domain-containing protein [Escherichia coli]|nr:DUF4376 domain-containing protein [Escherichia coli]